MTSKPTSQKILVIDDDPTIRAFVGETLEDSGFEVVVATNGLEATHIINDPESGSFSLVVVDMMMPLMNGLEFVSNLRKQFESDKLPVIMLSAEARPIDKEAGLQAGADLYIVKPCSPEDLIQHVRKMVR